MMLRALVLACLLATPAAADDWYVRGAAGAISNASTQSRQALTDESALGGSVGYSGLSPFRFELGVSQFEADSTNRNEFYVESFSITNYRISAFYDFALTERAALFVGGGLDSIEGDYAFTGLVDPIEFSGHGHHLALGASYAVSDAIVIDAMLRRVEATISKNVTDGNGLDFDEATLGLRVRF